MVMLLSSAWDFTWFRAGGPAEVLYSPADEADLAYFLRETPADIPITIIGLGSNLLVRDGGIEGVVIRLGRGFGETIDCARKRLDIIGICRDRPRRRVWRTAW